MSLIIGTESTTSFSANGATTGGPGMEPIAPPGSVSEKLQTLIEQDEVPSSPSLPEDPNLQISAYSKWLMENRESADKNKDGKIDENEYTAATANQPAGVAPAFGDMVKPYGTEDQLAIDLGVVTANNYLALNFIATESGALPPQPSAYLVCALVATGKIKDPFNMTDSEKAYVDDLAKRMANGRKDGKDYLTAEEHKALGIAAAKFQVIYNGFEATGPSMPQIVSADEAKAILITRIGYEKGIYSPGMTPPPVPAPKYWDYQSLLSGGTPDQVLNLFTYNSVANSIRGDGSTPGATIYVPNGIPNGKYIKPLSPEQKKFYEDWVENNGPILTDAQKDAFTKAFKERFPRVLPGTLKIFFTSFRDNWYTHKTTNNRVLAKNDFFAYRAWNPDGTPVVYSSTNQAKQMVNSAEQFSSSVSILVKHPEALDIMDWLEVETGASGGNGRFGTNGLYLFSLLPDDPDAPGTNLPPELQAAWKKVPENLKTWWKENAGKASDTRDDNGKTLSVGDVLRGHARYIYNNPPYHAFVAAGTLDGQSVYFSKDLLLKFSSKSVSANSAIMDFSTWLKTQAADDETKDPNKKIFSRISVDANRKFQGAAGIVLDILFGGIPGIIDGGISRPEYSDLQSSVRALQVKYGQSTENLDSAMGEANADWFHDLMAGVVGFGLEAVITVATWGTGTIAIKLATAAARAATTPLGRLGARLATIVVKYVDNVVAPLDVLLLPKVIVKKLAELPSLFSSIPKVEDALKRWVDAVARGAPASELDKLARDVMKATDGTSSPLTSAQKEIIDEMKSYVAQADALTLLSKPSPATATITHTTDSPALRAVADDMRARAVSVASTKTADNPTPTTAEASASSAAPPSESAPVSPATQVATAPSAPPPIASKPPVSAETHATQTAGSGSGSTPSAPAATAELRTAPTSNAAPPRRHAAAECTSHPSPRTHRHFDQP